MDLLYGDISYSWDLTFNNHTDKRTLCCLKRLLHQASLLFQEQFQSVVAEHPTLFAILSINYTDFLSFPLHKRCSWDTSPLAPLCMRSRSAAYGTCVAQMSGLSRHKGACTSATLRTQGIGKPSFFLSFLGNSRKQSSIKLNKM